MTDTAAPLSVPDAALTPDQAAEYLGVAANTLCNWRSQGVGPAYLKYGGRRVAYLVTDLEAFRDAHRVPSGGGHHG